MNTLIVSMVLMIAYGAGPKGAGHESATAKPPRTEEEQLVKLIRDEFGVPMKRTLGLNAYATDHEQSETDPTEYVAFLKEFIEKARAAKLGKLALPLLSHGDDKRTMTIGVLPQKDGKVSRDVRGGGFYLDERGKPNSLVARRNTIMVSNKRIDDLIAFLKREFKEAGSEEASRAEERNRLIRSAILKKEEALKAKGLRILPYDFLAFDTALENHEWRIDYFWQDKFLEGLTHTEAKVVSGEIKLRERPNVIIWDTTDMRKVLDAHRHVHVQYKMPSFNLENEVGGE